MTHYLNFQEEGGWLNVWQEKLQAWESEAWEKWRLVGVGVKPGSLKVN